MPFQPDDKKLVALINTLLDASAAREIDRGAAMSALAHVMTAAAIGGQGEFERWLEPEVVQRWKRQCRGPGKPKGPLTSAQLVDHWIRDLVVAFGEPFDKRAIAAGLYDLAADLLMAAGAEKTNRLHAEAGEMAALFGADDQEVGYAKARAKQLESIKRWSVH
jgi:hypothetical protein